MKKIILILLFISISSCDKYVTITSNIDNQTDDTFTLSLESQQRLFECLPNSITTFDKVDIMNVSSFNCKLNITQNNVKITTKSGKILKKEIWNSMDMYRK